MPIALLAGAAHSQMLPDTTATVGRITIDNQNIFDTDDPRYRRFLYPVVNRLHARTKAQVIRRELLFSSGDSYNPAVLEESARNLRKFPFLGAVTLKPVPRSQAADSDTVDIAVTTSDQWTTSPDLVIDSRGNLSRFGIGLEEENLLGFGKYFNLRYVTSTDRTLWRTIYRDPRLLGSRWMLKATGIRSNEGRLVDITFARPLYSLNTRWAFSARFARENGVDRLYDDGLLSASIRTQRQVGDLLLTRVWRNRHVREKLTVGLSAKERLFPEAPIVKQPGASSAKRLIHQRATERQNLLLSATWARESLRYAKRRFINKAGLIEDIRVGPSVSVTGGWARGWRTGRDTYGVLSGSLLESRAIDNTHLLIVKAEGKAHLNSRRFDRESVSAFLHYYYQGLPLQTLALGASYLQRWNPDQPEQFVLGEDIGLRGFRARQFTGDRLLLINLENRVFTTTELATLRLGLAPFLDAGMAWSPEQSARVEDLAVSTGLSLRFGVNKGADAPVFRLDVAVPIRRVPKDSRYTIGFSFSPIFWSFRPPAAIVGRF